MKNNTVYYKKIDDNYDVEVVKNPFGEICCHLRKNGRCVSERNRMFKHEYQIEQLAKDTVFDFSKSLFSIM